MMNWTPFSDCSRTKRASLDTLVGSSAASTSSSTKNGAGWKLIVSLDEELSAYEWIENSSASAAIVFSPPESCSISTKRLPGGIVLYLTPAR